MVKKSFLGETMENRIVPGCGFHHVAVRVHNFDASFEFYKALGMTVAVTWGEGDSRAALFDTGDGNYIEIFAGGKPGEKLPWGEGASWIHVALRTNDVDGATETAVKAGAVVAKPPTDVVMGKGGPRQVKVRLSFVNGPGGEVIEFFDSAEL